MFKAMFIILVAVYDVLTAVGAPAAIGWAIVALTLVVRIIVIPLYRRQLTSQRRMQMLQPEIKEINKRFKGDSVKARVAQQELMKERGVSPLAGCLPLLLQMPLLFMMYQVIRDGLTNVNPSAMLEVFGVQVVPLTCTNINPATGQPDAALGPCINTIIPFLNTSINVGQPSTIFSVAVGGFVLGISILAIISAGLQLIQSRMMLPRTRPEDDDPTPRSSARRCCSCRSSRSSTAGSCRPACSSTGSRRRSSRSSSNTSSWAGAGCSRCSAGRRDSRSTTPRDSRSRCPRHQIQSKRAAILTDADKKTTAASTIRPREAGPSGPTRETTLT